MSLARMAKNLNRLIEISVEILERTLQDIFDRVTPRQMRLFMSVALSVPILLGLFALVAHGSLGHAVLLFIVLVTAFLILWDLYFLEEREKQQREMKESRK